MFIKIKGGSKLQKKVIRQYGKWLGNYLLGPKLTDLVEVKFVFDPTLHEQLTDGFTDWEFPDGNTPPREFTITIDSNLNLLPFIECLTHEMVHVKQYAKGELRQNMRNNTMVWKRTNKFDVSVMDNIDGNYHELPWEIEAHGRERGLYVKYLYETGCKPYSDGEFLANVYKEDGTFMYGCTMKEVDGEIKPLSGYYVNGEPYKGFPEDTIYTKIKPNQIKKIILGYEGFRFS